MGRLLALLALCAGCRTDLTDWEVSRLADRTPILREETQMLVVGQPLALALSLQSHESNHYFAPSNVRSTIDHPSTLQVTVVGEVEFEITSATHVDVQASQVGPNRVRFISDDTDEVLALTFMAVAP